MLAEQHACAVGSRVVAPVEDEDGQRKDGIEADGRALRQVGVTLERQHTKQGKGQGHVNLTQERVRPVVEGTTLFAVKFAHKQVNQNQQVGDEDAGVRCLGAVAEEGKEQQHTAHGGDERVDRYVFLAVHQPGKLPQREARNEGEQQSECKRAVEDAADEEDDKQYARDASLYEIVHSVCVLVILSLP